MPSLDSSQVSDFTGAATYSVPIKVPPSPADLKPDLELSYNSQVIDQSLNTTRLRESAWGGLWMRV